MHFPPVSEAEKGSSREKNLTYLCYGLWCDSPHGFQAPNSFLLLVLERDAWSSHSRGEAGLALGNFAGAVVLGNILVQRKKSLRIQANCYLPAPWESSLEIKVGVFILLSDSDFFWWPQNGTWIQRQVGPLGHGAKSCAWDHVISFICCQTLSLREI